MHNYTNPSELQDLSHVEAQVTKGNKYYDDQGWEIAPPISDRECILKCLENCEKMDGLDRKQVRKLIDEFSSGQMEEDVVELISEYPPL